MAEPHELIEGYLGDLSGRITRPGRPEGRLLTELRDHLEDSAAAHIERGMTPTDAARQAIELAGPSTAIAEDWKARRNRRRRRQRNKVATLIGTAAAATALAVAQHAQGRRTPPQPPCGPAVSAAVRPAACGSSP